jgi:hypothetical protein
MSAVLAADPVRAHSGPPYPIVSRQAVGMYRVSVWTDPDATDDGTAGGQFWVVIEPARAGAALPPDTRAEVAIRPLDREGPDTAPAATTPVDGDVSRQFVAVLMDHEGPYRVHVALDGAWGAAAVDTQVEATYDLRPPLALIGIYLLPFAAVGFLWTRLLLRRRRSRSARAT